jgi:hypothetical protein
LLTYWYGETVSPCLIGACVYIGFVFFVISIRTRKKEYKEIGYRAFGKDRRLRRDRSERMQGLQRYLFEWSYMMWS